MKEKIWKEKNEKENMENEKKEQVRQLWIYLDTENEERMCQVP